MWGSMCIKKKKLGFQNFPATLTSQRRKPKRLVILQGKDKRPALQQGPDLCLEPKWLRCLCTDHLITLLPATAVGCRFTPFTFLVWTPNGLHVSFVLGLEWAAGLALGSLIQYSFMFPFSWVEWVCEGAGFISRSPSRCQSWFRNVFCCFLLFLAIFWAGRGSTLVLSSCLAESNFLWQHRSRIKACLREGMIQCVKYCLMPKHLFRSICWRSRALQLQY